MAIDMIKIRAEIRLGGITAGTPPLGHRNHVLSFNVDKARAQVSSFSASLKVSVEEVSGGLVDNAYVEIYAGTSGNYLSNKIFTGIVRSVTITPNRDDPSFVILNISGNDVMSRLQGKKFTRRCRSTKGTWVSIDSVSREGLRDGKFMYVSNEQYMGMDGGKLQNQSDITSTRDIVTETKVDTIKHENEEVVPVPEVIPVEV